MAARVHFPHQETALAAVLGKPRIALFMQMRLGKTPVVIRWALDRLEDTALFESGTTGGRVLVVGPMSVLDDWIEELQAEGVSRSDIYRMDGVSKKVRLEIAESGSGWYLINFEGMRTTSEIWQTGDCNWDVIIVDESTGIRNPQAKITKVMTREFGAVPYRALLSGNPAPESPMDYFSQFQFLTGSFLGFHNFWSFRGAKFKQSPSLQWLWSPKPGVRDEIRTFVHDRAYFLTRKEAGVGGIELPPKRRVVDMNDAQRKAYAEIKKKYSFEYIETNFATVRDIWLARVAGGFSPDRENPELLSNAKTQEILDLMKGELKGESVVIWFRFNEELHHVVAALNRAKIPAIGVTGATSKDQRKPARNDFARGVYQVICIQVQLGRYGWNLSRADTVIYYSRPYDLESNEQSRDRVVHPMKTTPYVVIDLVTRNSIDEAVQQALKDKNRDSKAFRRNISAVAFADFMREELRETQVKEKTGAGRVTRRYPGTRTDR